MLTLTAALTVLVTLINPVPAAAHVVGTGGSPTNYRTRVTAIRPAVATVGLGGQWVRVTDQGAATIVILGYRSESILRRSPYRVQINQLSATAAQTGLTSSTHPNLDTAQQLVPRWVLAPVHRPVGQANPSRV
ncbi:MAG: hypothetical protein WBL53_03390 [Pseudonocardiaceae bacterium]